MDLEFPALGSLYFVDGFLDSDSKQPLDKKLLHLAHCASRYWDCDAGEPRYYHNTKPNRGLCRLVIKGIDCFSQPAYRTTRG